MLNIAIWRGVGSAPPFDPPSWPRSGGVRGRGLAPFPWRRGLMAGRRTVIAAARVSPAEGVDRTASAIRTRSAGAQTSGGS